MPGAGLRAVRCSGHALLCGFGRTGQLPDGGDNFFQQAGRRDSDHGVVVNVNNGSIARFCGRRVGEVADRYPSGQSGAELGCNLFVRRYFSHRREGKELFYDKRLRPVNQIENHSCLGQLRGLGRHYECKCARHMCNGSCNYLREILLALLDRYVLQGEDSVGGFLGGARLLSGEDRISSQQKNHYPRKNSNVPPVKKAPVFHHRTPLHPINNAVSTQIFISWSGGFTFILM